MKKEDLLQCLRDFLKFEGMNVMELYESLEGIAFVRMRHQDSLVHLPKIIKIVWVDFDQRILGGSVRLQYFQEREVHFIEQWMIKKRFP
jgi:hypothetical protein